MAMLVRTFQVMAGKFPVPDFIPPFDYRINDYLAFDVNWPAILAGVYLLYYFILEPVAAVGGISQAHSPILVVIEHRFLPIALVYPADDSVPPDSNCLLYK